MPCGGLKDRIQQIRTGNTIAEPKGKNQQSLGDTHPFRQTGRLFFAEVETYRCTGQTEGLPQLILQIALIMVRHAGGTINKAQKGRGLYKRL